MAKREVVFHSKFTEHNLTRQPKDAEPLRTGGWRITERGVSYQFHAAPAPDGEYLIGVCVVKEGQDVLVDHSGWLNAEAEQGIERDAVQALRSHYAFGADFWEAPVLARDFRRSLRKAAAELDEETVLALIAEEQRTGKRRELLDDAEGTLEIFREERQRLEADAAAAEASNEAEAAKQSEKPAAEKTAKA